MTTRKEGQETNWWSSLHIKLDKRGDGYVSFKMGNMEYIMKYETFLKVSQQLIEDYYLWKHTKRKKNEKNNN